MASAAEINHTEHVIVLRADTPERRIDPHHLEISAEGHQSRITSVVDGSTVPTSIALVMDTGPDQSKVLGREKELASSLINKFSNSETKFSVIRAGYRPTTLAVASARPTAATFVESIVAEPGKKSAIAIYDAVALAIQELSTRSGIRVLIIIAEGNDSGSRTSYRELREAAEAQHVSCMTAIVTDHSTRGTKAILRYGWDLQELAGDTAGLFIENDKHVDRAVDRLQRAIKSLRLVTFEIGDLPAGRHKVSVSSKSAGRLKAQRAIVVGNNDRQTD